MPKLNSLEVVHQDTNKDSYETLHDIIVGLKGSQNQEVIDEGARALYESLLELYTNDKEAFAKRIETLQSEFGDSLAKVVEEMLAYASASEAYARKITTLSAETANTNAMIQNEMSARATEDEALATSITTLSATVGSKNRTYYQSSAPSSGMVSGDLWIDSDDNKLYRYDGSSWVNIQDNQIGVNTAAISSEATARATADSANATSINAVTARLDTGDFATVKTQSSTTASKVSGIEAKWGVTTNVNGHVAGIQLLNGGSTQSTFTVAADKFVVMKPNGISGIEWNGATSRLNISGDVYADGFYGNVVSTGNINNNAVSIPLTQTLTNNLTGNGAYQQASVVSFSTSYPINILVVYNGQSAYTVATTQNVLINVDGVDVSVRGGDAINDYPTIAWSGLLAAGSHTVRVYWYGANSNVAHASRTLSVLGNMR